MTSNGYIIMIIVDSCMIWLHFDCIMQLKKSYRIATNVCSRKSATTFGDISDCLLRAGIRGVSVGFTKIQKASNKVLCIYLLTCLK